MEIRHIIPENGIQFLEIIFNGETEIFPIYNGLNGTILHIHLLRYLVTNYGFIKICSKELNSNCSIKNVLYNIESRNDLNKLTSDNITLNSKYLKSAKLRVFTDDGVNFYITDIKNNNIYMNNTITFFEDYKIICTNINFKDVINNIKKIHFKTDINEYELFFNNWVCSVLKTLENAKTIWIDLQGSITDNNVSLNKTIPLLNIEYFNILVCRLGSLKKLKCIFENSYYPLGHEVKHFSEDTKFFIKYLGIDLLNARDDYESFYDKNQERMFIKQFNFTIKYI